MAAVLALVHGALKVLAFGWFMIKVLIVVVTLPFAIVVAIFGGKSVGKHISSIMDKKLEQQRAGSQS